MVCGAVEATVVVVGGIGDSVVIIVVDADAVADEASELGSDFGGSEDSVEVVEGGAGTLLVVSGFSLSCLSPGVGLVVDEGSSGLMSLLLGGSLG
jgi:hypothetical protein